MCIFQSHRTLNAFGQYGYRNAAIHYYSIILLSAQTYQTTRILRSQTISRCVKINISRSKILSHFNYFEFVSTNLSYLFLNKTVQSLFGHVLNLVWLCFAI